MNIFLYNINIQTIPPRIEDSIAGFNRNIQSFPNTSQHFNNIIFGNIQPTCYKHLSKTSAAKILFNQSSVANHAIASDI